MIKVTPGMVPVAAVVIMTAIAISYFIYLVMTWRQYQKDRDTRDTRINEVLDRLPKPAES